MKSDPLSVLTVPGGFTDCNMLVPLPSKQASSLCIRTPEPTLLESNMQLK